MENSLTFYLPKDSPLHRLTPTTKLLAVVTIIMMAFLSPYYWLPTCLFLFLIIPISVWGQIGRPFWRLFSRILLPAIVFLFIMQSFFYPGGKTEIFHIAFLSVEQESVIYGYLISSRIAVMVSAFILFLLSTHPGDLMVDLTSRGVPSMFSYIITTSLQIIPQMRMRAYSIIDAQRSRGLETEGPLKGGSGL